MEPVEIIHSEAIYGAKTKQPLVRIAWGDKEMMCHVEDAKRIAYDILDCAHASDGDAFIVDWLRDTLKVEEDKIWQILLEFRTARIRKNGEA